MNTGTRLLRVLSALLYRRLPALAALGVLLLGIPAARAQLGLMGGEMGDLIKPTTNARQLKQYAEILGLSPEQKRAADELLIAYQSEFRDGVSRLEEIYQSINEESQQSGEWELQQTVLPGVMLKFLKRAETLNTTFMNDLKTLLDPQQAQRFALVERLHRRKSAIKMGLEGLQGADLGEMVDGLRLDRATTTNLAGILEQYSIEQDRELTARDKMMRGFIEDMVKMMDEGKNPEQDPAVFQKWMKDMNDAGDRLDAVASKYVPQVRSALPDSSQAAFDNQIKLAKYPMIYKVSYASRVFDAAGKITDLDATQKEGLKTLKESYLRDAATANDKWAGVLDELKKTTGEPGMFNGAMWRINQDAKYVEVRDARKALDDKAVDAVKALLTEPQRAKLPKKNYRPEWDFDRTHE